MDLESLRAHSAACSRNKIRFLPESCPNPARIQPIPNLAKHQECANHGQSKAKTRYACCASSNQHVCSLSVFFSWLMVNLAYLAHSGDLMRATGAQSLPSQELLLVRMPTFAKLRFSLLVVFRILCFTKLPFLQLQKRFIQKVQKFCTLWTSCSQSCTADAGSCGSRQNWQRFTLCFSGVQILLGVLLYSELDPQLLFFGKYISSIIQRRFHFAFSKFDVCIYYVRLP